MITNRSINLENREFLNALSERLGAEFDRAAPRFGTDQDRNVTSIDLVSLDGPRSFDDLKLIAALDRLAGRGPGSARSGCVNYNADEVAQIKLSLNVPSLEPGVASTVLRSYQKQVVRASESLRESDPESSHKFRMTGILLGFVIKGAGLFQTLNYNQADLVAKVIESTVNGEQDDRRLAVLALPIATFINSCDPYPGI